jgi:hypothetical protein
MVRSMGSGGSNLGRILLVLLVAGAVVIAFSGVAPVAYAQTSNTYSDSSCSTPQGSFLQGSTVYGGGASLTPGKDYWVGYYYPTNTPASIVSLGKPTSGKTVCDGTGFALTAANCGGSACPTGTWTLKVCTDSTCNATPAATSNFTVSASVPEFPFGFVVLVIPIVLIYMLAKKRDST